MSVLTSLLVRDRVVPVSKIEEALQHQVLVGGDIETILLEMNLVPEDVLNAYRAALFGLLPATREEVMRATREVVRRVPRELARGAGFVPLLIEGRTLIVAASEPPNDELSRQIRGQLGYDLTVRVITPVRLSAALAHHYGYDLDARTRRLTEKLRSREAGVIPYVAPPTPSVRATESVRQPFGDEGPDTLERSRPNLDGAAMAGFTLSEPATPDDLLAAEAASAASAESAPSSDESPFDEILRSVSLTPPPQMLAPVEPPVAPLRRRMHSTIPPSTVSPHISRGVRGPIGQERVLELLSEATQRDDVLYVLLRYAQQFFDFVAVFSLGKDGARGRMAHGAGLEAELMEQVVIPLEGGGMVALAARDKRPVVGDLSASDDERAAAALLGRPAGRPGVAVPVTLRSRAVLLVYGDRDDEGVSIEDATPLLAVAPAVSEALRRLIVENKTLRRPSERPPEPGRPQSLRSPALSRPSQPAPSQSEPRDEQESASQLADHVARSADGPVQSEARLTAVDLEGVNERGGRERRRAETLPLHTAVETGEAARTRMFGVPRTAPPPPGRESLVPPSMTGAGAYSYVAPAGVMEETVRPMRHSAAPSSSALAVAEARALPMSAPTPDLARLSEAELRPIASAPSSPEPTPGVSRIRPSQPKVDGDGPSIVIDMGDHVDRLVQTLMQARPNQEPAEIEELLTLGEAALPVLLQHFPGPLWFDRHAPGFARAPEGALRPRRRPRGRDVSAVARAVVAFGDRAAPYLASALNAGDPDVRYYALLAAGEVVHPDLLDAVAKHALDSDDELRAVSLDVLRSYTGLAQFGAVLRAIADLSARAGKDPRRQRLCVEALGELRDPRALRSLLPRLSDASEAIVQAAHRALVTLTGQDFGLAQKKWEAWAEQWGRAHRVEWLIESLLHGDEGVRSLASEELKQLTQQYFGYHPQLPRRDREVAQRKYREWWETEGRQAFGYFN